MPDATPAGQGAHNRATAVDAPVALRPATHEFLKALASQTRQRIMLLFAQGGELSVGEVAERSGLSQPTASQQLAILARGGIVTARRAGKTTLYRGDREGTSAALADLQDYVRGCC